MGTHLARRGVRLVAAEAGGWRPIASVLGMRGGRRTVDGGDLRAERHGTALHMGDAHVVQYHALCRRGKECKTTQAERDTHRGGEEACLESPIGSEVPSSLCSASASVRARGEADVRRVGRREAAACWKITERLATAATRPCSSGGTALERRERGGSAREGVRGALGFFGRRGRTVERRADRDGEVSRERILRRRRRVRRARRVAVRRRLGDGGAHVLGDRVEGGGVRLGADGHCDRGAGSTYSLLLGSLPVALSRAASEVAGVAGVAGVVVGVVVVGVAGRRPSQGAQVVEQVEARGRSPSSPRGRCCRRGRGRCRPSPSSRRSRGCSRSASARRRAARLAPPSSSSSSSPAPPRAGRARARTPTAAPRREDAGVGVGRGGPRRGSPQRTGDSKSRPEAMRSRSAPLVSIAMCAPAGQTVARSAWSWRRKASAADGAARCRRRRAGRSGRRSARGQRVGARRRARGARRGGPRWAAAKVETARAAASSARSSAAPRPRSSSGPSASGRRDRRRGARGDEERGGGAEGDAGVDAARVEARGADLGHPPRLRAEDAGTQSRARGRRRRCRGAWRRRRRRARRGAQRAQRGAQRVLAAARKMDEVGERAAEYRAGAQVAGGRGCGRARGGEPGGRQRAAEQQRCVGRHAHTPIRPPSDSATPLAPPTVRARR